VSNAAAAGSSPSSPVDAIHKRGKLGLGHITPKHEEDRAQPNISLAWIERQMPIKQDADREHYLEGFRRTGLE
jgi:hypothetical protein